MKRFDEMNPLTVAFYYLCVLAITMFSMNPLILCISLLTSVIVSAVQHTAARRAHLFSLAVFIVAAIINPIAVHKGMTVLFYVNGRPFTLEAIVYGLAAAAMLTASLYRLRSMSKSLTSDKVLYLFGRFSPKIALILSMTLRFVELLKQRWRKIRDTQRTLGLYDDGTLIDLLRGNARILSVLITWTLENGIITAESMESRGYGTGRRTSYATYKIHAADVAAIAVCAILTTLAVFGVSQSTTIYYPFLQMELFTPWGMAGAAAFLLLSILPLILDAKEAARWHLLLSKT
ncbi:MAG: energy-coupling factor transporter transmembrane protein EcfT [Ruminococcus sp.]|nr:energy-coupling factor transporter transmembrane protein EcfT [Ruminococcus sp.]